MTTRLYVGILLYMLSLCMASHAPASPVPQNVEKKEKTQQLKTQMKSIREALKGKKGADALKGVENIRKDTAEWWNIQALQYGVEACRLLADTENEKLYLKHNPDTTAFFNAIYNICRYVLLTDRMPACWPNTWATCSQHRSTSLQRGIGRRPNGLHT